MTSDHEAYALICPQCGEEALTRAPSHWMPAHGPAPAYSHTDGEPLCPVITPSGYRPAEPIE